MMNLEDFITAFAFANNEAAQPVVVKPLNVTANDTYTAPEGHAFSPVNVDVTTPLSDYEHSYQGSGLSAINPSEILSVLDGVTTGLLTVAANIGGNPLRVSGAVVVSNAGTSLRIHGGDGTVNNGVFITLSGLENATGLTCDSWTVFQNGTAQDLTAYAAALITFLSLSFYA